MSVVFTNPAVLRPNEVLGTGQVRRQIARAHLQWVRDYQGPDALSRLLSELPFEVVEEIAAAPSVAWSSFRSVVLLDRAIESMFGRGKRGFLRELGRYSAHLNLSPFRTYRPEDLHRFFARMPLLHRQFQDFGVVSWVPTSESSGSLSHREYSSYSAVYCESALGYYEQIIVAHGAAPQLVIESSCQCAGAGSCTFELAWD